MTRVVHKRILLADDEEGVREAVRLLLDVDQHSVTEASDGCEALNLFNQQAFDLVITDYAMPGIHGAELALRIKEIAPTQPVIMITAYADLFRSAPPAVDAVLNKPFSFESLRRAIADSLEPSPPV
jgi:CheY-like chemotaxis protein